MSATTAPPPSLVSSSVPSSSNASSPVPFEEEWEEEEEEEEPTVEQDDDDTHMDPSFVPYRLASAYLLERLVQHYGGRGHEGEEIEDSNEGHVLSTWRPRVGIICGSGLSGLSAHMTDTLTVSYAEIPGFPAHCTVPGHCGQVVLGRLAEVPTLCFRGRFHSYEGHHMKTVVLPVNVMRCMGVQVCIVTNAAGGLNPSYQVGHVVAISDHLALPQLAGKNPLIGPNDDELGPRFPATSNAYPHDLRRVAQAAAEHCGLSDFFVPHGVYCFVSGPMYESIAECRFLRAMGGDAVGMSTVPEVVTAHHCHMKTLCLSLITNQVVTQGDEGAPVASHAEVLEAVQRRQEHMQNLVQEIVSRLRTEILPHLPPLRPVSLVVPTRARPLPRDPSLSTNVSGPLAKPPRDSAVRSTSGPGSSFSSSESLNKGVSLGLSSSSRSSWTMMWWLGWGGAMFALGAWTAHTWIRPPPV